VDYITIRLPFDVNGDTAKELLSTAWLFKIATHRVLSLARQQNLLPGSKIGWRICLGKWPMELSRIVGMLTVP